MLGRFGAVEQRRHRGQELVGDRAAEAAVRELDDVVVGAVRDAAAPESGAVDAERAELVDDHRDPPAAAVREHVADEARLAGAEKAADDRRGNAGRAAHPGILPVTAARRLAARRDGSTAPVGEAA